MYRAGIEGILGMRREGGYLIVDPCLPAGWPGFQAVVTLGKSRYDIRVEWPFTHAALDETRIACCEGRVRISLNEGMHHLWMGAGSDATGP